MVKLREIDRDNFHAVLGLSVFDEQNNFVASNCYSLAQAKAQPECVPLAIYDDEELVGFVMYCLDFSDSEYWIYRIMIDKKHQKNGYGRIAIQQVLEVLRMDVARSKVYISFEPENEVAKRLYENLGFAPDGRIIGEEIVYCLNFTSKDAS
ncbi:MAG: GNAT family N-acetyltransferase [Defluviitaleaceae bacterium]|nr:GNAT family N-acetyltransferase [Defluviitaleaceae bacterium]